MRLKQETCVLNKVGCISLDKMLPNYTTRLSDEKVWFFIDRKFYQINTPPGRIALRQLELCRRSDPPQAENPASRILFNFSFQERRRLSMKIALCTGAEKCGMV